VASKLFFALQLDLPFTVPVGRGRYLLRDPAGRPERVVVVGQAERGTVLTLIEASPLADAQEGERRLAALQLDGAFAQAAPQLARIFQGFRLASATLLYPPSPADLAGLRAGYGKGQRLAEGRLERARELGGRQGGGLRRLLGRPRRTALAREDRLAAILSGRLPPLLCEELALRARLALASGELPLALHELRGALHFALLELPGEVEAVGADLANRLGELQAVAKRLEEQGQENGATPSAQELEHGLARLEAALRLRALVRTGSYKGGDGADG